MVWHKSSSVLNNNEHRPTFSQNCEAIRLQETKAPFRVDLGGGVILISAGQWFTSLALVFSFEPSLSRLYLFTWLLATLNVCRSSYEQFLFSMYPRMYRQLSLACFDTEENLNMMTILRILKFWCFGFVLQN